MSGLTNTSHIVRSVVMGVMGLGGFGLMLVAAFYATGNGAAGLGIAGFIITAGAVAGLNNQKT